MRRIEAYVDACFVRYSTCCVLQLNGSTYTSISRSPARVKQVGNTLRRKKTKNVAAPHEGARRAIAAQIFMWYHFLLWHITFLPSLVTIGWDLEELYFYTSPCWLLHKYNMPLYAVKHVALYRIGVALSCQFTHSMRTMLQMPRSICVIHVGIKS